MEIKDVNKLIRTLNPVNGCNIGCSYCYARNINKRFHITPDFNTPQFVEKRLKRIGTKTPNNYLMTSMSDFSGWKDEWRTQVFDTMKCNPQHTYLFLTKRPENINFKTELSNVWMGVTITTAADKIRIPLMLEHIQSPNYFLTFEPLHEDVGSLNLEHISWIVIGTETGYRKGKITAKKEWIDNIVQQAKQYYIPIFMKAKLVDIVGSENMLQDLPKTFIRRDIPKKSHKC